jgi:dTDP-4-dehydrorhamnose reductase
MSKKVLLLGATGKMGLALSRHCPQDWVLTGLSSADFDAATPKSAIGLVERYTPDIVINTVGFLGIDPCEAQPELAFQVNTLFPYDLAQATAKTGALLVHFSSDAVFNGDEDKTGYVESDAPDPVNVYGMTKLGGDCLVKNAASAFYIIRISVLFGPSRKNNQFVEKMLDKIRHGANALRIADDILCSPCYSEDVARGVFDLIRSDAEYGLYHMANAGSTSLFGLMNEVAGLVAPQVTVEPGSHLDFPFVGRKNLRTPLASERLAPLPDWRDAVRRYLAELPGHE